MEIPDDLAAVDYAELNDIFLRLWHTNRFNFSSLTPSERWVIVFREFLDIRRNREANRRKHTD